ncbi:hypothetical protein [Moorena producens]
MLYFYSRLPTPDSRLPTSDSLNKQRLTIDTQGTQPCTPRLSTVNL